MVGVVVVGVVVVGVVVVAELLEVECAGAVVVVVVARAGGVVVVEVLGVPLRVGAPPPLEARVVVVAAPRELSDNAAGFE